MSAELFLLLYHSELCRQLKSNDGGHTTDIGICLPSLFISLSRLLFKNSADNSRRNRRSCPTVSLYLVHFIAICYIFKMPDVCKLERWNTESFCCRIINFFCVYDFFLVVLVLAVL